jgi:hypothetical protein
VACWFGGIRFERWRAEPDEPGQFGIINGILFPPMP